MLCFVLQAKTANKDIEVNKIKSYPSGYDLKSNKK